MSVPDASGSPALERLLRWERFGGHWRISPHGATDVEVRLLTCDGGEVADRFLSGDGDLIRYLGGRMSDDDGAPG